MERTHFPLLIDGKPVDTERSRELVNPYTAAVWATAAEASPEVVEAACEAAERAFPEWSALPGRLRAERLLRFADAIDAHSGELAELETIGNGKTIRETSVQMGFAARLLRYFAGLADKIFGSLVPMEPPTVLDFYERLPHGPCAVIVAWNSPIQLALNKLAPALAAGNTIVLKPSELAPASLLRLAQLASESGLPDGVLNVVSGDGETGAALVGNNRTRMVSFTGGAATGRRVAATAGERLVPVVLELGGKSPNIVCADADLERAVPGVIAGIFGAAGQTCMAGSRLLAHEAVADELVERIVAGAHSVRLGDPLDKATDMGPLISRQAVERSAEIVEEAVGSGATAECGHGADAELPDGPGFFFPPTVLSDVSPAMRCVQEEIFAPVLAVQRFSSDEEAIELANGTEFGLAAGVWTERLRTALSLGRSILAGTVWINDYRRVSPGGPFGGFKDSGHGRERGMEALRQFTTTRNFVVNYGDEARDPFRISV